MVDTGSTDPTPDIARRAGATVVHAPWPGDLGAAHDLPLAHASGDWVLSLDGDEVLDPAGRDRILQVTASGDYEGYQVLVRNYSYAWETKWRPVDPSDALTRGASGYIPTHPIRLFRRRNRYSYTGLLHQDVGPSIRATGGRIGDAGVIVHHYGYLRFDRAKSEFYGDLARRHAQDNPDNPRAWVELGVVLVGQGALATAVQAFARAWSLGDRTDAAYLLGSTITDLGHARSALPFLEASIRANPRDDAGHYDLADAWEALGLAYEDADRRDDAEAAYRGALASRPDSPGAMHNLAALLLETDAALQLDDLLERLLARYRGAASSWSLLGRTRLRSGDVDAAVAAFRTALDIRPENLAARVNLAVALKRAGQPREAAAAYRAAADGLGSDEARTLGLESRLPASARARPALDVGRLGPGLVVSLIPSLAGGSGRVLADGVAALSGRHQLVVAGDAGLYTGQGLRAEIEARGVPVLTVASEQALRALLRRVDASVVLHHWWNTSLFPAAAPTGDEHWICVGHAPLPMPLGYDAYVVNSLFHRRFQDHLPDDRVTFLPNGVDTGRFAGRAPDRNGPVRIGMLSRLEPGKFPRRLLACLPDLDGAQVVIGGYGGRRYELEPEIAERGLAQRIRFVGPVPSAEVPDFLGGLDIGLHLTETHEELCSMVILEMLAAGLPIVAEPKGGLAEMIDHGRNGFLVRADDEVAEHLARLVGSPALRARMGAAGRETARRYDMAGYHDRLRALVARVEQGDGEETGERGGRLPSHRPHTSASSRSVSDPPRQCYLVCAPGRSGSTWLCETFGDTGLAGYPTEYFTPSTVRLLTRRWGSRDFAGYLREVWRRHTTLNGVFGAKLELRDVPRLAEQLRDHPGRADLAVPDLLAAGFPGLRYVWLTRRDKLRQAISWERAAQTGLFENRVDHPAIGVPQPRFDRAAIAARMARIADVEARWETFFSEAGVEPVRVEYEELVADVEGTIRRLLAELGIPVPGLWLGPSRLVPGADELTEAWVRRFLAHQRPPGDRDAADGARPAAERGPVRT